MWFRSFANLPEATHEGGRVGRQCKGFQRFYSVHFQERRFHYIQGKAWSCQLMVLIPLKQGHLFCVLSSHQLFMVHITVLEQLA